MILPPKTEVFPAIIYVCPGLISLAMKGELNQVSLIFPEWSFASAWTIKRPLLLLKWLGWFMAAAKLTFWPSFNSLMVTGF